mmetsp:Transcript_463/g.417  ORF Transcript_463/g.417 Transcript_463/m.417 type:complete len:140 (-) Transcript_463:58-477(-)
MSWRPDNDGDGDVDDFKMMQNKSNAQVIYLYIFKYKRKQYKTVTTVSLQVKDDNWNTSTEKSEDNVNPGMNIQNNLDINCSKNDGKIPPPQSTINLETKIDRRLIEESKEEELNQTNRVKMKKDLKIPKKPLQAQEEEI